MKQEIKTTEAIFPMPVLMISTFNEDGSVDVMNAAWGTMLDRDKVAKSGMTYTKSELVDAPIINEFPIALECEFIEYQSDETGLGVIGKVLRTSVEEANMKDGKVDIDSLEAIAFDPYTHGYYKVSGRVGEAFKDGAKLK